MGAIGLFYTGVEIAQAQTRIPSVDGNNFGVPSDFAFGDRDLFQVVFFEIPASYSGLLHFAIEDPDAFDGDEVGIDRDDSSGAGTVNTTFSLYGGSGAFSDIATRAVDFGTAAITPPAAPYTGTLLAEYVYNDDSLNAVSGGPNLSSSGEWAFFPAVSASQGELIGNRRYFKVVVKSDQSGNLVKNGFRLDVSVIGSGTPTGLTDARAFAYGWTVNFRDQIGTEWDFYPFVPDDETLGSILTLSSWDMDDGEGFDAGTATDTTGPVLRDIAGNIVNNNLNAMISRQGTNNPGDVASALVTLGTGGGTVAERINGTWRLTITEDAGGGQNPNTSEIFASTSGTNPTRIYASQYVPADPDYVIAAATDGTALSDGTETERVTFQLVDAADDPVPYVRDIFVSVDNGANIQNASSGGSFPTTSLIVTTDADGVAWIDVSNTNTGITTVAVETDGSLAGASALDDQLDNTNPNVNATIDFVTDPDPTISSVGNTSFASGSTNVVLPNIVIDDAIGSTINTTNNIIVRIPGTAALEWVPSTGSAAETGGPGGVNPAMTVGGVGNRDLTITVNANFGGGETVTISNVQISSTGGNAAVQLELIVDGATVIATDDKVIAAVDVVFIWEGDDDGNWTTAANWVGDARPTANDGTENIFIDTIGGGVDPTNLPVAGVSAADLTIGSTSTLDIAALNLTVNDTFSNEGALALDGGQTITLTNGMDTDSGAVEYRGVGTLPTGLGTTFHNLLITTNDVIASEVTTAIVVNNDLTITSATTITNQVTVSDDLTINAGAAAVNLTQATNAIGRLNVTGASSIDLASAVALEIQGLVTTGNATIATDNDAISDVANVTINVGGNLTLSTGAGTGGITIGDNAGDTVTVTGALALTSADADLALDSAVDLAASSATNLTLSSTGAVAQNGAVTVTTDMTVTSSGTLTQSAALDVGGTLSIDTGGNNAVTLDNAGNELNIVAFAGNAGAVELFDADTSANALTVNNLDTATPSTLTITGANNVTLGTGALTGASALTGALVLTSTNGQIAAPSAITATGVTITAADGVTLGGAVAVSAGAGTIVVDADSDADTTGTLDLGASGALNASAGGALTVTAAALTAANAANDLNAGTSLLTINSTDAVGLATTTGGFDFADPARFSDVVTAGSLTVVAANNSAITLGDLLDASAVTGTVTLTTTGTGTVDVAGSTTFNELNITGNARTTANGAAITTSNDNITFGGTIEANTANTDDLTLTAGTGTIAIGDDIGGTTPLGDFSVASANQLTLPAAFTAATGGAQSYVATTIQLGGATTMSAGGQISFNATTLNGGTNALTLRSNDIDFAGAAGAVQDITDLTLQPQAVGNGVEIGAAADDASGATLDITTGDIAGINTSVDRIVFGYAAGTSAVRIPAGTTPAFGSDTVFQSGGVGGSVQVLGTIANTLANASVTINATDVTIGGGGISTTGATSDVDVTGTTSVTLSAAITTAGNAVSITGATALATAAIAIDTTNGGGAAAGANIDLNSAIDGTQNLTVTGGTGGDVTFGGAIGAGTAIAALNASGNNVTLAGIGGGAAGAASATVTAQTQITLAGATNYRTSGVQDYDSGAAASVGTVVAPTAAAAFSASAIQFGDVYIDAFTTANVPVTFGSNVTARTFVVYRGALNIAGITVATTQDFVAFGAAYDPDDPARTLLLNDDTASDGPDAGSATNALFAYPEAGLLSYYPAGGGYNTPNPGEFATAPTAAFAANGLLAATINVSGDFYANGINFDQANATPATNRWTLSIPATANTQANLIQTANDRFGADYAVFLAANIDFANVTGGTLTASVQIPGNNEYAFGVTDGTNNTGNVALGRPDIASAHLVNDRFIRIDFSEAIENDNGEIVAAITEGLIQYDGGADGLLNFFTTVYTHATHTAGDPFDESTLVALTNTDVSTIYLRVADPAQGFKTDASGSAVGGAINGGVGSTDATDRAGDTALDNIPDIHVLKGALRGATGGTMIRNYGYNQNTSMAAIDPFNLTADDAGPLLYRIEYGRAASRQPIERTYDGHNYVHFFYSEPVDIGTNAGFTAANAGPSGSAAQNFQSAATFTAANPGGDFRYVSHGATDAVTEIVGYIQYTAPLNDNAVFSDGARPGVAGVADDTTHALYRHDAFPGMIFGNTAQAAQQLRIYVSGYLDGALANERFPGWHSNLPNIGAATAIDVLPNADIRDAGGNAVNDLYDTPITANTFRSTPGAVTASPTDTVSLWIDSWDVSPPIFATYELAPGGPPFVASSYEIVLLSNVATGLVNRLEFHVLDNTFLDLTNVPNAAGAADPQIALNTGNPSNDPGFWDGQDRSGLAPSPLTHANDRTNEGLRDSTLNAGFGTPIPLNAFFMEQSGVTPLVNTENISLITDVNNTLFGTVSVTNDSYFSLTINSNAGDHPWGQGVNLAVDYFATGANGAYITDLAGNLLPSTVTPLAAIEQTPPSIELALGIVGSNRLYLKFSEPVSATAGSISDITAAAFALSGTANTAVGIDILTRSTVGASAGAVEDVFLTLANPIAVDEVLSARIAPSADTVIYDVANNPMLTTQERRLTDVAIGIIEPVWATDSFGINDAPTGEFRTIRVFDGTTTLSPTDITLQARLLTTDTTLATSMLYTIDPQLGSGVRYWSPDALPGLVETDETTPATELTPTDVNGAFRDFQIPGADPALDSGTDFQFQFRVQGVNSATAGDLTDPRTVQPWSFDISTGFIAQRANVTILNNVIYPERGENTILTYELDEAGMVNVLVFALDGTLVRTIHRGRQGAGTYRYTWDGRNQGDRVVARGIYFIRVVAPGGIDEYRKVIVAKD